MRHVPKHVEKWTTEVLFAASSVVASSYDMCARAFEMGWAGVAFKTISFLDIHEASPRFSAIKGDNGSMIGFKNIEQLFDHALAENMDIFARLKKNYPNKFLLVSIMGRNEEEWATLAKLTPNVAEMSEAGLAAKRGGVETWKDTQDLERDTIVYPKFVRSKCIGCGRCAISCRDGGHQAIHFGEDRKPVLDPPKCVGCHLCTLVCPEQAIVPGRKRI